MDRLNSTIGNRKWLQQNAKSIAALFPETWTHPANINFVPIAFHLKLLGLDFRSQEELARCLAVFELSKIIMRDGYLLRRAHL